MLKDVILKPVGKVVTIIGDPKTCKSFKFLHEFKIASVVRFGQFSADKVLRRDIGFAKFSD